MYPHKLRELSEVRTEMAGKSAGDEGEVTFRNALDWPGLYRDSHNLKRLSLNKGQPVAAWEDVLFCKRAPGVQP